MAGKTLTIVLAADISRLSKGLRSAQGDLDHFGGRLGSLGSTLSAALVPGLLGAAAAAGTLAVAMGVQGVKAAIAEESANAKLAKTLENLGFQSATEEVQAFIETQMRATGVADDLLRPAYDRLIRSTHDIGAANDALALSMDVSAGTSASLQQVTNALGKAYDGNFGALSKLGAGIDKATIATGDMDLITAKLAQTFGGQAATQAETFGGQLQQLKTAGEELAEAFGKGVIDAFTKTVKGSGDLTDSLYDLQTTAEDFGTAIGTAGGDLVIVIGYVLDAKKAFKDLTEQGGILGAMFTGLGDVLGGFGNPLGVLTGGIQKIKDAFNLLTGAEAAANVETGRASEHAADQAKAIQALTPEQIKRNELTARIAELEAAAAAQTTKTTGAIKINTTALDAQNDALDKSLDKLRSASDAVKNAGQAYTDFTKTLSGQIMGEIDLVGAFGDAVAAGENPAAALGRIFEQQDWYTNVLAALKSGGATQAVIDAVSAGGLDGGVQMGQGILDLGLIPYLNENLYRVENTADAIAKTLVPPFILAGQQQAIENLDAMSKEVLESGAKLKQIGRNIGKPISNQITKEISEALKQAWLDIDAAKSAAEAAAVAAGAARRIVVSDQQAIQQLNQILSNGNARAGYQESVVIA